MRYAFLFAAFATAQLGHAYPAVFDRIDQKVLASTAPVVVFDLDDTLFSSRPRTLTILKELAALPETKTSYPWEARVIETLRAGDLKYELSDTFAQLGLKNPDFLRAADAYYRKRFFSSPYCAIDPANPGAVDYVRRVAALGARIVYLTGRDRPSMEECTRRGLAKAGFPVGGSELMMKPDAQMDDLEFKKSAFAAIRKLGEVEAAFDNEPRNINALHAAFPEAVSVYYRSIHSNRPIAPAAEIPVIDRFLDDAEYRDQITPTEK